MEDLRLSNSPEDSKKMKPYKVIILGPAGAGKTSLVHRFTKNEFKDVLETIGKKEILLLNFKVWITHIRLSISMELI